VTDAHHEIVEGVFFAGEQGLAEALGLDWGFLVLRAQFGAV
jgi:hypothetical protein